MKKPKIRGGKKAKWLLYAKRILLSLFIVTVGAVLFVVFSFSSLLTFLPDSFKLAGFPFQAKNYLLVAQNTGELRPTGGFASAFALVQFRSGKIHVELHDVYGAVDDHAYVEPPYPYGDLLANENYTGHSFRDANVYADFPSSAEEFIKFFNINEPDIKIDGVVAINYDILEDIVAVLGEIEVEDKNLNAANIFENIEYELNNIDRHDIEQIYTRKQFLQPLLKALIKKTAFHPEKWGQISEVVYSSLYDKKIQLYFKDAKLEKKYRENGWAGAWPNPTDADFFAVVDTNLGGMKSNRYIVREVSRALNVGDNAENSPQLTADVDVKISHLGADYAPLSGDYTGFIRFYTPDGSDFVGDIPAGMWKYFENGRAVFAQKINLKPGESTHVSFSYSLPEAVLSTLTNQNYNLYVPRQSSTNDFYSLIFKAPRGMSFTGNLKEIKENVAMFRENLGRDINISLALKPDTLPPLVIFQKILSLNSATIHFNESVKSPINPDQFELIDLNFNNPTTDSPKIISVEVDKIDPRIVNLTIDGLTEQAEERYKLKLKGIEDSHGNVIDPNPSEITLIQRNLAWIK